MSARGQEALGANATDGTSYDPLSKGMRKEEEARGRKRQWSMGGGSNICCDCFAEDTDWLPKGCRT